MNDDKQGLSHETYRWNMAAVSRATGLSAHTLRVWERRYGFPKPDRLPSGHRRFSHEEVERLRAVASALKAGHRPGDVIHRPLDELRGLAGPAPEERRPVFSNETWRRDVFRDIRQYDAEGLAARLRRSALRLGARSFLTRCAVPLVKEVGRGWADGELEIGQEHLFTEVVESLLRFIRESLEIDLEEPPVILATLPGELHGLGLQFAALLAAIEGRSCRLLGVQTPPGEIAEAARFTGAAAVGLSVSASASAGETAAMIRSLRELLPASVPLWIGGGGSLSLRLPGGVIHLPELGHLERALRGLSRPGHGAA